MKSLTANTRANVHWLADHDESGQAVHSGSFAPANRTFRATDSAKCS